MIGILKDGLRNFLKRLVLKMAIQKANINCETCGWMILTEENVVFCQNPKCMVNGKFKHIKPL